MIPAFAEAVRATTQPCTLLPIASPLLVVLATRGRWAPLVAAIAGAVVGGWLFMANLLVLSGMQLRVSGVVVAGALLVLAAGTVGVTHLRWAQDVRVQSAIAAGAAFIARLWWRPCVGSELGAILTDARSDGIAAQIPAMTAYMLGAMVPVVAAALIIRAINPTRRGLSAVIGTAAVGALLLGGALVLGRYDQLVSRLTSWSTA
jgi:cytochrome c biogenesis protein CcdA